MEEINLKINNICNMLKKSIVFVILLLLSINSYADELIAEIDINKYQDIIFSIVNDLSIIMEDNHSSEIVYNTFIAAENAIRNNEVTFKIDPRLNTVLSGMQFATYESGEISLVFGLKYLDTYNPNSSIHYSILIHEYRHLHDYLKNGIVYINAKKDEKEAYWYELDALRIEAEFIKYYLFGKFSLSRFEEYILQSFDNNYLNSASIVILKECMDCFFSFNNLGNQYKENRITKEEIIKKLENDGNKILNYFIEAKEEFAKYFHFIEINTFQRYMIRILVLIINKPEMTWGEVFERYPNIGRIYENMREIINNYSDIQSKYLQSIYEFWENDILEEAIIIE